MRSAECRGLGVFDAVMLVALWQFDEEDVLAGLLVFGLVYYIAPFALPAWAAFLELCKLLP
jgi:hypothetical protein